MAGGQVQLRGLTKRFAEATAVDGINTVVNAGEFFSLLGPSRCGKTTTLRMIAGFARPTEGEILLDGEDVASTPPHLRNVHTVFQNYALFPHLDVSDNIAFGLRRHKVAKDETPEEVYENPATVFVADFLGVSNLMMDAQAVGWGASECTVRVAELTLRAACGETAARGQVKIVARPEPGEPVPATSST